MKPTVETVHLQHHVGLLSVGRPLQQGQRVSARGLGGGARAQLRLLIGLDEAVLQQRLAADGAVVRHEPERGKKIQLMYERKLFQHGIFNKGMFFFQVLFFLLKNEDV